MIALQNNDKYIGQLLVKDGIITSQDLERGLTEQKKGRDFLCSTLVRLGLASEEKIFSILSLQIGIPFLSLKDIKVEPTAVSRVPGNFALACNFMPVKVVDDCLYIAMSDPLNTQAIEEIRAYIGTDKLRIFLAGEAGIRGLIKDNYGL